MLDDLRNTSDSLIEDDDSEIEFYDPGDLDDVGIDEPSGVVIFGMTPPQRFLIALMILLIVCVMGAGCLILTERVALPVG
jgi:hypothetical protein